MTWALYKVSFRPQTADGDRLGVDVIADTVTEAVHTAVSVVNVARAEIGADLLRTEDVYSVNEGARPVYLAGGER